MKAGLAIALVATALHVCGSALAEPPQDLVAVSEEPRPAALAEPERLAPPAPAENIGYHLRFEGGWEFRSLTSLHAYGPGAGIGLGGDATRWFGVYGAYRYFNGQTPYGMRVESSSIGVEAQFIFLDRVRLGVGLGGAHTTVAVAPGRSTLSSVSADIDLSLRIDVVKLDAHAVYLAARYGASTSLGGPGVSLGFRF